MFKRVQRSNPFDSFVSPGVANVYVTRGKRSQTTDAIEGGTSLPGEPHLCVSAPPRLCQYDPDGNLVSDGVFAYAYDSASRLTTVTSNGVTVAAFAYDAFGNTIAATGPLATTFPHRFSTKYFDPETGFYYYGYRWYSPSLMRWLTRDPIEETGGVNLYAFCGNETTCHFDPFGMMVPPSQLIFIPNDSTDMDWSYKSLPETTGGHTTHSFSVGCHIVCLGGLSKHRNLYGIRCNVCVKQRIFLNENDNPYTLDGTYGHEQRHVDAFITEVRSSVEPLLSRIDAMSSESRTYVVNQVPKYENDITQLIRQAEVHGSRHVPPHPQPGTVYPPNGNRSSQK